MMFFTKMTVFLSKQKKSSNRGAELAKIKDLKMKNKFARETINSSLNVDYSITFGRLGNINQRGES